VALGLIEVRGLAAAIGVLDTMAKTAEARLIDVKKDMGGGLVTIVIEGDVSAVTACVQAGEASCTSEVIAARVFANPDPQMLMYVDNSYKSMRLDSKREALGIIEVYGFVCAMTAADAALKAADVRLIGIERTKGESGIGLIVALKFTGRTGAVNAAIEAGTRAAKQIGEVISTDVNALPDGGIDKMVHYTNLKSD